MDQERLEVRLRAHATSDEVRDLVGMSFGGRAGGAVVNNRSNIHKIGGESPI
jgi:hypothetical protein